MTNGQDSGSATPDRPPTHAALEGLNLSKRYGGVQALLDVSIAARAGEVLGLLGENGAGKSTLVKILSGLVRPDAGTIRVRGGAVDFHVPRDAQQAGVRIVPQELLLYPYLSVTENLLAGQLPIKPGALIVDWRRAHEIAHERLGLLGLDYLDVRAEIGRLSIVERAFVQVARVLDSQTRVMILDEPTAPMNGPEVEQTLDVLRRVKASGVAIIYISHRLHEVFEICDRVAVLRDGKLVRSFDRSELNHDTLVSAMVSDRALEFNRLDDGGSVALARRDVSLEARELRSEAVSIDALVVHAGEIASVYGLLGSGREEIARVLVGLTGAVGSLRILDRPVQRRGPAQIISAGVGYVPAERRSQGLALELSVRENMTLGMLGVLSRRGVLNRRGERAIVEKWRKALHVATSSIEAPVGLLSGGSQQKVLLARWLAAGKRVLVLEEPTRGVDIATKAEIYRVLQDHCESGGAALVVSSDLEEVARISDRVLVMHGGRVVRELEGGSEAAIAAAALAA